MTRGISHYRGGYWLSVNAEPGLVQVDQLPEQDNHGGQCARAEGAMW